MASSESRKIGTATPNPVDRGRSEWSVPTKFMIIQALVGFFALGTTFYAAYRVVPLLKERRALVTEIALMRSQLEQSTNLLRNAREINLMDVKYLFEAQPCQAILLSQILSLRNTNVQWKVGGNKPEEGFDSPGFAEYILVQNRLISPTVAGSSVGLNVISGEQQRLLANFPDVAYPQNGDLVFYKTGYTMFYFETSRFEPGTPLSDAGYVIGMTPFGIVALGRDFAERIRYGRVDYSKQNAMSCR